MSNKFSKVLATLAVALVLLTAGIYFHQVRKQDSEAAGDLLAAQQVEREGNSPNSADLDQTHSRYHNKTAGEKNKLATKDKSVSGHVDEKTTKPLAGASDSLTRMWPPRPAGESDLDRIKRLMQPLEAGKPSETYKIRVFQDRQIVAVYTDPEADGSFSELLHAFACSSCLPESPTPSGEFSVGIKLLSGYMMDASYCKFCTEFKETYYFHAPPSYGGVEESGVSWEDYNTLGEAASHGCIRLTTRDAKWIYENVAEGSQVEILDSSADFPELPEVIDQLYMQEGEPRWDPTNDNAANPYLHNPEQLLPYNRAE